MSLFAIQKKIKETNKANKTLDQLCELLGITNWDEREDFIYEQCGIYGESLDRATKDGLNERDAEERAQKEEQEYVTEKFYEFKRDLESVTNTVFERVGLEITSANEQGEYRIKAIKSWREAALAIVEVINGDGCMGSYDSLDDALTATCSKNCRAFVLSHLAWIDRYARVFGEKDARTLMSNRG